MLSIPHLIIIFVVALVVFGPEKLPELARNIGKVMGDFKRASGDLRSTLEGHLRDLERDADQRRIGGGTPSPTSAVAEVTAVTQPVPGAIPTDPPHVSAAGGLVEDPLSPNIPPIEPAMPGSATQNESASPLPSEVGSQPRNSNRCRPPLNRSARRAS